MDAPDRPDLSTREQPLAEKGCDAICPCCTALTHARQQAAFDPRPQWNSPLTPGVQAVNLSHSRDSRELRGTLGDDWPRMCVQLAWIGPAQIITLNPAAILNRRVTGAQLDCTSDGAKTIGCDGKLRLDFRHFGSARVVHLRRPGRHSFEVEFADLAGEPVHALMLTHASDFDAFFAWVRLHQACAASDLPRWQGSPPRGGNTAYQVSSLAQAQPVLTKLGLRVRIGACAAETTPTWPRSKRRCWLRCKPGRPRPSCSRAKPVQSSACANDSSGPAPA